ncbi:PaeR7I family type II restriction endonuclease [Bifidobacterium crudilactis]|uniref:PaeR7I family type II restriction endonuclease n=1 Tax=Bifidobacterium crudilactis TaxID=327277 RepID=UPI0026488A07|nr:PaeR7I family type II restriction endonuclease [Bifidobacterium crudilactis]MDN5973375.1 PaeR7I family type II restriction endonuclease [Bifidobacterium crudilactis]MDN6773298.1 PaeR7I family type II restriction endonuclease [Bifidobacterium crudilactis]
MKKEMEEAILEYVRLMKDAKTKNAGGDHAQQGNRGALTSGKHMSPIEQVIRKDLMAEGLKGYEVYSGGLNMNLPGWYRPAKNWDLLAVHDGRLIAAIELKSQNSSAGNNFNNRVEESLGSAEDASKAVKNGLIPGVPAPAFAFAMFVTIPDMMRKRRIPSAKFNPDPIFKDTSYWERYVIFLQRAIAERLYQTSWLVFIDTEKMEVTEPCDDFTYEKFITMLKGQTRVALS